MSLPPADASKWRVQGLDAPLDLADEDAGQGVPDEAACALH
jgi:hypothetical protein